MKSIMLSSMIAICLAAVIIVRAGRDGYQEVAGQAVPGDIPSWLEHQIPFDIRISTLPREGCDPVDLNVITTIRSGSSSTTRWQVVDDERIQMEFSTFDNLYYQCDGPGCFNIRSTEIDEQTETIKHHTRMHVCLK